MELIKIARVQSGYISRKKIETCNQGAYFLIQARDMDADSLTCKPDSLISFEPVISKKDWVLEKGDILFMARGARNFSVLLSDIPGNTLAAACFFIIRVSGKKVLPGYLCWYLNQAPAVNYFRLHSGRGVNMPVVRRSVLENIDIPVPSPETQNKVIMLNALMREEQELIKNLANKRKELLTTSCLKASGSIKKI